MQWTVSYWLGTPRWNIRIETAAGVPLLFTLSGDKRDQLEAAWTAFRPATIKGNEKWNSFDIVSIATAGLCIGFVATVMLYMKWRGEWISPIDAPAMHAVWEFAPWFFLALCVTVLLAARSIYATKADK